MNKTKNGNQNISIQVLTYAGTIQVPWFSSHWNLNRTTRSTDNHWKEEEEHEVLSANNASLTPFLHCMEAAPVASETKLNSSATSREYTEGKKTISFLLIWIRQLRMSPEFRKDWINFD